MAITVISEPSPTTSAHDCVCWSFRLDDIGDPAEKKLMAWSLKDELGNTITHPESYWPASTSEVFLLNFTDDVKGLVTTMIPLSGAIGGVNDQYIVFHIQLDIWEVTQNVEDCTTTEGEHIALDRVLIVNGVTQDYETNIISGHYGADTISILSHLPLITKQCRGARNYLWILEGTTVTYSTPGQTNVLLGPPYPAYYIPLYIQYIFPAAYLTAHYFEVSFSGSTRVYRIYLEACCCDTKFINILYLDPKGSRTGMSFECVTEYKVDTNFSEVNRYIACNFVSSQANDASNKLTVGGKTIMNKQASERFTLVKTTFNDNENMEWLKSFVAASGYLIQTVNEAGAIIFRKFIIDSGQFVIKSSEGEIDLVISGFMSGNYKLQTLDR